MDGLADMGGQTGWGPVSVPNPNEEIFPEKWEGRSFAITLLTMGRISGQNLDAFRHALERLDRADYLDDGYYGRWLHASELMLVESSILAPGAVEARARNIAGEQVEEPAIPEPNKPDYAATAPGSLRTIDATPAFAVGDRIRTSDVSVPGHTRLPSYTRGREGVIEIVQPAHILSDTNAHFLGENPEYLYSVRFDSRELWGAEAESFELTIELFESYLEKA